MSTALLDRPMSRAAYDDRGRAPAELLVDKRAAHGPPRAGARAMRTLDEHVVAAWEGLLADALVDCPVCQGKMLLRHEAAARGGDCLDCGTSLE